MYGDCPYWECPNRNEFGYCKTTVCINPKYQSNTYRTTNTTEIVRNETYYTDCLEEVIESDECR